MWQYNKTENMYSTNQNSADELYHYGVLGMRWGHRHSEYRQSVIAAKQRYKNRNSAIQKRYDMAEANIESKYKRGQMLSKKDQARENHADTIARRDWARSKATYKADRRNAKAAYKANVAKDRQQYKANYKKLKENDNAADKLIFSTATRKQAAKYMTFDKMSMSDARKKARTNAIKNSAIIAAIGAAQIGSSYIRNRINSGKYYI